MKKFLIFGLERSGTTSLLTTLGSVCPVVHEPFHSMSGDLGLNPAWDLILERNGYLAARPVDVSDDFSWNALHFLALDQSSCHTYLGQLYAVFSGVKHLWSCVSREANEHILDWCFANDIRVVLQSRRRLARALISRQLAEQSQVWQLGEQLENRGEWRDTDFDPVDLELLQEEVALREEELDAYHARLAGKSHLRIDYEDLFMAPRARREAVMRDLCAFISLPSATLPAEALENWIYRESRRQSSRDALRRVPNYQELKAFL